MHEKISITPRYFPSEDKKGTTRRRILLGGGALAGTALGLGAAGFGAMEDGKTAQAPRASLEARSYSSEQGTFGERVRFYRERFAQDATILERGLELARNGAFLIRVEDAARGPMTDAGHEVKDELGIPYGIPSQRVLRELSAASPALIALEETGVESEAWMHSRVSEKVWQRIGTEEPAAYAPNDTARFLGVSFASTHNFFNRTGENRNRGTIALAAIREQVFGGNGAAYEERFAVPLYLSAVNVEPGVLSHGLSSFVDSELPARKDELRALGKEGHEAFYRTLEGMNLSLTRWFGNEPTTYVPKVYALRELIEERATA